MHPKRSNYIRHGRRVDALINDGPGSSRPDRGHVKLITDTNPINRLGGMAGKPANHVTAQSALRQNIPKRFRFPRRAGDRTNAAAVGNGLHKTMDAVLMRK